MNKPTLLATLFILGMTFLLAITYAEGYQDGFESGKAIIEMETARDAYIEARNSIVVKDNVIVPDTAWTPERFLAKLDSANKVDPLNRWLESGEFEPFAVHWGPSTCWCRAFEEGRIVGSDSIDTYTVQAPIYKTEDYTCECKQ
jgi:hypothetical protein